MEINSVESLDNTDINDILNSIDLNNLDEKAEVKSVEIKPVEIIADKPETQNVQENPQEVQEVQKVVENVQKVVEKTIPTSLNEKIEDFACRYLELQRQKKIIDEDIKALKQEYAEQGIAQSVVTKALTNVQRRKKMSYTQLDEIDKIQSVLEQSRKVDDAIKALKDL